MQNKQNIRRALKAIEELIEEVDRGMYIDNAMDGSGECGGMIARGWAKWFNAELDEILKGHGIGLQEMYDTTDAWAKRELEMGPKKVFISWNSRGAGMYKEVDYTDTRWGAVAVTMHNYLCCNEY